MQFNRHSLRHLAIFAVGILALIACQNSTEPSKNESGPISATATYSMANSSRLPDSISWKAPKDSGARKQKCNTSTLVCSDTFQLSKPLGQDSIVIQLWTLGIRTYTLYFGEKESPTTLGIKASHCDLLDTLLLSKYNALTTTQKASFSALGQGASSLVDFYASLLLARDTTFVGKSLPVGMKQDSVEKHLVYLAGKQGLTIDQLLDKAPLSGLDSATVLRNLKLLIKAKILDSDDSAALVPPYPVRVKTPIAVNGTLTAGGSPVALKGVFAWTKGQNIKAPIIQVRTAKPGDSAHFTTPTKLFTSTDTIWNLDGNLTLQASSSASAGTDTLVITIYDDAGHGATSRTEFQVASSATAPTISPNGGTFYSSQNVIVTATSADSIQTSTDSAVWTKYTTAVPVTSSTKLHARAFKGGTASPVTTASFVLTTVPAPSITPNGGSFYGAETVVVAAAEADSIQTSTDSSVWTKYTSKIVVKSSGKLHARAFKGGVASAVVSAAFTSSTVPVPTIAPNGGTFYKAQTVSVTGPTGTDSLQTSTDSATWNKYNQSISISASGKLHARSFAQGVASPVVTASFNIGTVPVPSISPNGGTFYSTQTVTVSAPETDSVQTSTDSATWTKYTTGVSVSTSGKLYTRAFKGGVASSVVTASFTIATVPVPSITPNGGTFYASQTATVAAPETDSVQTSTDSATWTKYTTGVSMSTSGKLHVRAFKGGVASSVVSASFVIGSVPVPSISPNGGMFYATQTATVAAPETDSVQTSTDSATWTKYTTGVSVSTSGKLHARAFKDGVVSSVVSAGFTIGSVPVPAISPNGGTFYFAQNATVSADGADSIQTSTDSIAWTKYTTGVSVSTNGKLYARAFKGGVASTVAWESFTIGTVPVPSITPNGGSFYGTTTVAVAAAGSDSILISTDSVQWNKYTTAIVVSSTQKLHVRAFKGGVASSVVSASFTSSAIPVPTIAPNGGTFYSTQSVSVTAPTGTDSVQTSRDSTSWTKYTQEVSISSSGKLHARSFAGGVASPVVSASFTFATVPVPSISPNGGTFYSAQNATVTAVGTDSIQTSTDSALWTKYTSVVPVTSTTKLHARAFKGGVASAVISASYVIGTVPVPVFSPNGGLVSTTQDITLTAMGSDSIQTSLDGTTNWTKYASALHVSANRSLYARAFKGGVASAVVSAAFTVPPVPTITPGGGPFSTTQTVSITIPTTAGAVIQISTNNGVSWNPFVALSVSTNIKVLARTVLGGVNSTVAQADFAFPPSLTDTVAKDTGAIAKVTVLAPGADEIMVSTDGTSWMKLTGSSYSMTASGTLYAIAHTGSATSPVASLPVQLFQRPPSISPGGVFPFAQMVTIAPPSSAISGTKIYYTVDGSTPTAATSTLYSGTAFHVGASKRIKAIVVTPGYANSAFDSEDFAIADTNTYGIPWNSNIVYGAIQDARDGQVYRTLTQWGSTWMAQNLNYAGVASACRSGSTNKDTCNKYGRYYSWATANGLPASFNTTSAGDPNTRDTSVCPSGWKLPWAAWEILLQSEPDPLMMGAGNGAWGPLNNTSDQSGFRALPGPDGGTALWWYSPEDSEWPENQAWSFSLSLAPNSTNTLRATTLMKNDTKVSVRCILK